MLQNIFGDTEAVLFIVFVSLVCNDLKRLPNIVWLQPLVTHFLSLIKIAKK